jgi:putative PIN family toxin of toxin-antitoxin system
VRVFLDTNLLASAFATRDLSADVLRVVLSDHVLVTSEVVLDELTRVRRGRMGLPGKVVDDIEAFLREHEVAPRPPAPSALPVRDRDDRWMLAAASESRADVLVAGDRDLLDVASQAPLTIVDPRGFWRLVCT